MSIKKLIRILILLFAVVSFSSCSIIAALIEEIKGTVADFTALAEVGQYAPDLASLLSGSMDGSTLPEGVTISEPVIAEDGTSTTTISLDNLVSDAATYDGSMEIIENVDGTTVFSTGVEPLTIIGAEGEADKVLECDLTFDDVGDLQSGIISVDGEEVDLGDYYDILIAQGLIDPITIGNTTTTETGEGLEGEETGEEEPIVPEGGE